MLTLERRFQNEEEIWTRRVARIAAGLPLELPKPEEEEEEQQPVPMEVADSEEDEAEPPEQGFNMAEAELAVTQAAEMTEQQAILESIQDEAYVEANRQFFRQEQAASDALFAELEAEIETEEAGAEQPEEAELQLPPMLLEPGTEIVDIFEDK